MMGRLKRASEEIRKRKMGQGTRIFYKTTDGHYWEPSKGVELITREEVERLEVDGFRIITIEYQDRYSVA